MGRVQLVHLGRRNAGARLLFCFPSAGGSVSSFHAWARRLPPDIELVGAQLPGRGHLVAETPYGAMDPLVADLAQAMWPLLHRPFMLFGHSMGSLVAFELA